MPGVPTLLKSLIALAPLVAAAPANLPRSALPTITEIAQPVAAAATSSASPSASAAAAAPAAAGKLTDIDILNL